LWCGLGDSVTIPKELLRELYEGLVRVEEVLATLGELMDEEGVRRVRGAEEEYRGANTLWLKTARRLRSLSGERNRLRSSPN
jgi:hypothetical protein